MDGAKILMNETIPTGPLQVINIGLERFAEDLRAQGVAVIQLDWRPPAGGNARLASLLASMDDED